MKDIILDEGDIIHFDIVPMDSRYDVDVRELMLCIEEQL